MKKWILFYVGVTAFIVVFLGFILTFAVGLATGLAAFKVTALCLIVVSMVILYLLDRNGR